MVNKQPLVSAIVPAYNAAATIERVVQGLLQQTYPNIEIIVVNDGSTDTTQSVVEKITKQDNRVRLINQSNAGPGAARNKGIENGSGEFVMFFDADDDFSNKIIEKMVVRQRQTQADFVACSMTTNQTTALFPEVVVQTKNQIQTFVLKSLLKNNLLYGPYCKLFRLNQLKSHNILFNTELCYGEDTIFVLQYLSTANVMATMDESLYKYYYTNTGIAFKNRLDLDARRMRDKSLKDFCKGSGLMGFIFGSVIRFRWYLSLLKAKVRIK